MYPPWLNTNDLDKFWIPTELTTTKYEFTHKFGGAINLINFKCITDAQIVNPYQFANSTFVKITGNDNEGHIAKQKILDSKLEISKKNYTKKIEKYAKLKKPISKIFPKNITNAYNKEVLHINEYVRATKVRLDPTDLQKNIIKKWMDIARMTYDKCVDVYNSRNGQITTDYKKFKLEIFRHLGKEIISKCPYHILTYEVKEFCSNVKACLTQITNKNIKHFRLTHKNVKQNKR